MAEPSDTPPRKARRKRFKPLRPSLLSSIRVVRVALSASNPS